MRTSARWSGVILAATLAVAASAGLSAQAIQRALYVSVLDRAGVPVAG